MPQNEQRYMRVALKLARQASRRMSSRPLVGAVAVTGGRAAGHGYSGADGKNPAALAALERAGSLAEGSTLYTNAEPCSDTDDTAQSLLRIIAMRPKRVVIGALAPWFPLPGVANGAIERLRSAGIAIDIGLMEKECREFNAVYYKYAETGLPFVTLKFAASLDGRIATATGDSQWISSKSSLRLAHQLRRDHDAVLVGIGTVLSDNPRLTVRLVEGASPLRVVVDSRLSIPLTAGVLSNGLAAGTLVATTSQADPARIEELKKLGVDILVLPAKAIRGNDPDSRRRSPADDPPGRAVDLSALLVTLGERGIASILVEGGSGIITSLLAERRADRLVAAIAPKIIGRGLAAIGDLGIERLSDAITFASVKTRKLGPDMIFDGRFDRSPAIAAIGPLVPDQTMK
jgi:diaminohydroxyphosphoribosylaminopyrimidine deaminase / 5-amino-6-(5-phosphoribosylamino)uracil reductase